ncbi:MAG: aldolase/citrate lyase family protein [Caldilineales bacterium]|nr:aldolase/citrate lyase family protein [Caldilineales bacterium]MDW8319677.1 aldolase/citrate lyase family protein [Anaerolineae bacterium]
MFLQPNRTKAKLRRGEPVFGVINASDDPLWAELCGLAGFDYYILDGEHGLINPAAALHVVRACERVGITLLVRLALPDPKPILPYLDAGMMGVMVPGLETAEEVERLVAAVKYPPLGRRGIGLARAAAYMARRGEASAYVAAANAETMVIIQFEDPALIERLPALAAVPGVDAVMIGPRDLSLAMGFADGPNHPEVQAMIERAIAACRQVGVVVGITAATWAAAEAEVVRGVRMVLAAAPTLFLAASREFLLRL